MVLSIILWLLIGAATAYFARQRGRDPSIWFLIGVFLGLLGLLLLFILPAANGEQSKDAVSMPFIKELQEQTKEGAPPAVQDHSYLIKDWFYLKDGPLQQGPLTFDDLKRLWKDGSIGTETFVWSEGMDQWKKIDVLQQLKDALDDKKGMNKNGL